MASPWTAFLFTLTRNKPFCPVLATAPNLLVASGTGSGKTEAFVLPILARILKEAHNWSRPQGSGSNGLLRPPRKKVASCPPPRDPRGRASSHNPLPDERAWSTTRCRV